MGFLDKQFGKWKYCPECRTWGARSLFGKTRCRNSGCSHFDVQLTMEPVPEPPLRKPLKNHAGSFNPANTVSFRYRNFQGEERSYTGDANSVRIRGDHVSIRLLPAGVRAAFRRKHFIGAAPVPPGGNALKPTPQEAQILGYWRRREESGRGVSLPERYLDLKKKFPSWR
jgi:hypothetical protein